MLRSFWAILSIIANKIIMIMKVIMITIIIKNRIYKKKINKSNKYNRGK